MKQQASISGNGFKDVLGELYQHAFTGVPGASDPFTLGILEREYTALALAYYYRCEHCQQHHSDAIERELRRARQPDWAWKQAIIKAVLFTRTTRREISNAEWAAWSYEWLRFVRAIPLEYRDVPSYIGYAIGVARHDEDLISFAWSAISSRHEEAQKLLGAVRDIERVVLFMKAATSENRTTPVIEMLLASRGVDVNS
ncbi:MAG: hypothetical protein KDJ47_00410 [Hyphomicrobiaceae bacterium]|nr:hypothetical protein [Hyphomicrobiaceae bacterium]